MIELPRSHSPGSTPEFTFKIIGLGGAGSNALDRIQLDGLDGAELIAINTDVQGLAGSVAPTKIQIGKTTTRGLGAGGDPEIGYAAAEEAYGRGESRSRRSVDGFSLCRTGRRHRLGRGSAHCKFRAPAKLHRRGDCHDAFHLRGTPPHGAG
jgi:cell division protein FtsZ